jgi:hypothetical protein
MTWFPPELLARTDELCAATPLHAGVRATLLDLEARGEAAGWDSPANDPRVYSFEHHPGLGRVRATLSATVNAVFRVGLARADGEPGQALAYLATVYDRVRERFGPATGLTADGFTFYGYGYAGEGWASPPDPDEEAWAYARRRALHEYPERIEIRQVYLAGRDGVFWWVLRARGQAAEAVAALPESTLWAQTGLVPNALARMTNALAGGHAPVPVADPTI